VAGISGTLYRQWRGTPLAGRVVAKTGWIAGDAGIVGTVAGRDLVDFAYVVNGDFPYSAALTMETAALDALLAYAQGWNKGLEPLVPSLQNNYWIYYHVPVVLAAYASFLIGFSTSILYLMKKHDEERALGSAGRSVGAAVAAARPAWLEWLDLVPASGALEVVTYRVIALGEILLTIGIILGSLWAHDAWGSYWQNDPKELAALTCWIWYAAYLHLHTRPSFRGPRLAWMGIAGFGVVLFCYFGVNIWISGLHSYK